MRSTIQIRREALELTKGIDAIRFEDKGRYGHSGKDNQLDVFRRTHYVNGERNQKDELDRKTSTDVFVSRKKDYIGKISRCCLCSHAHYLNECPRFIKMSFGERYIFCRKNALCFNCLRSGHSARFCLRKSFCRVPGCETKHSFLLHQDKEENRDEDPKNEGVQTLMGISKEHNDLGRRWLSLRTIPVALEHKGRELIVNALLDDASTTSYVSLDVANELGLRGKRRILPIEVIGGRIQEIESQEVKMTLKSTSGDLTKIFKALALSTVTGDMKVIDWRVARRSWAHLGHIQFPAASKRITVDVLIGSDYPDLHRALEDVSGIEGGPIARLTPLGWTCIGGPGLGTSLNHQTNFIKTFLSMENKLDDNIKKFWEIEEAVGPSENSKKDRELIDLSRKTIAKTEVGYEVALPWKICKEQLPHSRLLAEQRLASLCKKLDKEPEL